MFINSAKKLFFKVWTIKTKNTNRHRILKIILLVFFPLLLTFTTELNHTQSIRQLFYHMWHNPNSFIFSVVVSTVIFFGILLITRCATFSVFINWLAFYTFSWIEYFKFEASGTHFVVTDMAMIGNASDVTKFATVNIWLILNLNLFMMLAYTIIVFILNIKFKYKFAKSFAMGFACIAIFASFIVFPAFSVKVYSLFDIESSESANSFTDNDKFGSLNFIPYFVESATNLFTYAVKEPENYSEAKVKSILKPADNKTEELSEINIIYILSESFADFRIFSDANNANNIDELDSVYKNFDIMREEGFGGTCIVPTFGGYTSRSEFELVFGLPLKSIGTPALPNNKLKNDNAEDIASLPNFYKNHGYNTTYIHPFSRTFYNRDEIYSKYGFDTMIFDDTLEDWLPEEKIKYFRKYISDYTVFDCIIAKIKTSDKPEYILATTMQNHVPYANPEEEPEESKLLYKPNDKNENEYDYYLDGIKESDMALSYLKEQLESIDKKCVVIFVGDHFPFFTSENNKYKEININSDNCSILYEQRYFVWANFNFDKSAFEKYNRLSLFYIPNIITKIQGLQKSKIINTVLGELDNSPVYSKFFDKSIQKNETLDMLTYDLIIDKRFAIN